MPKILFVAIWVICVPVYIVLEMVNLTGADFTLRNFPIDIRKHLAVFDTMDNNNATYIVEILVDIPDTADTGKLIKWDDGYPGHSFIRLTKSTRDTSVQRSLGFYPAGGSKTLFMNGSVKSKLLDDCDHAFDAKLFEEISAKEFANTIHWLITNSNGLYYDINDFNCTDFAVFVFNLARTGAKIKLEKQKILHGAITMCTPNRLYDHIHEMVRHSINTDESVKK
jgi:hypothetical protein